MSYAYPLLDTIVRHYAESHMDVSSIKIYSCQHLLSPQYEMYKKLISFGFVPENVTVLGKAYSSNGEVIKELQDIGIRVVQPEFLGAAFDEEHTKNCQALAQDAQKDTDVVILDDGGALLKSFRDHRVLFGVEQTSSGFRMLEKDTVPFPIFNVARSKTKLTQESLLIGRHSFERVREYVDGIGIATPRVFVIGLGPVGKATCQIFEEQGITAMGCDIEMDKQSLLAHLREQKPDVVIGATGKALFDVPDLSFLEGEHVYHFVSISSSDREFPVAGLRGGEGVHDDVRYKNFVFVNNGFPITFKGNREELTPMEIEKTIGLLMGSILHGVVRGVSDAKGFIDVPEELEEIVNS